MPGQGYIAHQRNGTVLTTVVVAHVAILGTLMLIKTEVIRIPPNNPMETWNIPVPPPPPQVPPPAQPRTQDRPTPSASSDIDIVKPIIPTPGTGPVVDPVVTPDVIVDLGPVGPAAPAVDPPTPRLPDLPLPRAEPVKLKPRGNPSGWVTNDDYPAAALRSEEQGRTAFSLSVGADGQPTACTVTASSGSSTLDNAACRLLMRRARFVPGRDADGVPAGGSYANSFRWQIPEN